jgi:hypothetical protein
MDARLLRARDSGVIAIIDQRIINDGDTETYLLALEALQSSGFVYEMVMVLNREAVKKKLADGSEYGGIPDDAEPYYELDCRSKHGYKPVGEGRHRRRDREHRRRVGLSGNDSGIGIGGMGR